MVFEMAPYQPSSSARTANLKKELPSGYTSVSDILSETVPAGRLVSVIGLVKDYRTPHATNGSGKFGDAELYPDGSDNDKTTNVLSPYTINR